MKPSPRFALVLSLLLVITLAASVVLLRQVDRLRSTATADDVLYLSSPKVLRRLSLGYNGLLADIYWTRAVQYFGARHHAGTTNYALLAPLLTITTQLDPHLIIAYDFGANFLAPRPPDGAGSPDDAIRLVQYGIENNPDNWKLYYQLGFVNYTERKDYSAAADAFARGSRVPKAHPFLKVLAAQMAQHAGDAQMARALWTTTYQTTNDKQIQANAITHLKALQSDQAVAQLEALVGQFQARSGHLPASFSELVAAGVLRGIPGDPAGHAYRLMPDGTVQVSEPDELPFIEKGIPPGYKPKKIQVEP